MKNKVLRSLAPLMGLKLAIARSAGNMRNLHFGILTGEPHLCGQYALHIQCPWRLESLNAILTGSSDWYTPADPDTIPDDDWDPVFGGRLQSAVLLSLMGDKNDLTGSIFNRTDHLVVTHISADAFGGSSLDLSGGVRLSAFPSGSQGEEWRIFEPNKESPHFVVEKKILRCAVSCSRRNDKLNFMPDKQTIGEAKTETSKVGKRGTVVVPARLRRKFGIEEGTLVIAEEREDGVLIRPAVSYPVEIYTPERKAEFILMSAIDEDDYQAAREEVRQMGLDPDQIAHRPPPKR